MPRKKETRASSTDKGTNTRPSGSQTGTYSLQDKKREERKKREIRTRTRTRRKNKKNGGSIEILPGAAGTIPTRCFFCESKQKGCAAGSCLSSSHPSFVLKLEVQKCPMDGDDNEAAAAGEGVKMRNSERGGGGRQQQHCRRSGCFPNPAPACL